MKPGEELVASHGQVAISMPLMIEISLPGLVMDHPGRVFDVWIADSSTLSILTTIPSELGRCIFS